MRPAVIVLSCLALLVPALGSPSPSFADGPRLEGKFRITGTIVQSSNGSSGEVRGRTYAFHAPCPSGPCRKLVLRRSGPGGQHYRSILRKAGNGYKGKEKSKVRCSGETVKQKARFRFNIRAAEQGIATAITGSARFKAECPGEDFSQKVILYGELRP